MSVDILQLNYVPTLAIRSSEMNGLEHLPSATKDRLQPVFLLAPWPNAAELMQAIDRIQKAFGFRPFFLDIDRDYETTNIKVIAQQQWLDLQDPADNYANWIGFIESIPQASPCLQVCGLNKQQVVNQIISFQEMNRTFALRIELHRIFSDLKEIIAAINEVGSADFAIMIDAGWVANTQPIRAVIANMIRNQFGVIDAQIPIVVSYTTIPKAFTELEGVGLSHFDNRDVIKELIQSTNRQSIIYGDWGSTRPREKGMARRPRPRIDLPLKNGWLSVRNKLEDRDFGIAAKEIVKNKQWQMINGLGIWGEYMIRQTAVNPAVGINSPQKNVASRVNIHLHLQAFYDINDIKGMNLDEQWED